MIVTASMPLRTDVNNGPLCVAVINLKGGVGKTTIAALLGRHAVGALGLKVLAVDLDPQANLSQACMLRTYQQFIRSSRPSIVEVFSGMHPPAPGKPSPTPDTEKQLISNRYHEGFARRPRSIFKRVLAPRRRKQLK